MKSLIRFLAKNNKAAAVVVIIVALLGILLIMAGALNKQQAQLANQKAIIERIKDSNTQSTDEIHKLNNHIDCIVELFTQPNRHQLTIKNIKTCSLEKGAGSVSTKPAKSISSPPAPSNKTNTGTSSAIPAAEKPATKTSHESEPEPVNQTEPKEPSQGLLSQLLGGLL
jgi:cell division protein FtsB